MKKSSKKPKGRNPVAKNLKVNKPKVVPDKKKAEMKKAARGNKTSIKEAFGKAPKPKGGQMGFPTYGV